MPLARVDAIPDLSILMPVFNERATVERAIEAALSADLPADGVELVIVDDGSLDGTREILEFGDWGETVSVVHHVRNVGKGAAVRTALQRARGRYSAIMDADLEYNPGDIACLLEPLMAGDAAAVFGTRGFQSHSSYGFWYVMGNKAVTTTANILFNCWLSDIMTCHKAMSTELFRSLELRERGFAIEAEITARLLLRGVRIYQVPITYSARGRTEGKKLTAMDGARTLRTLVRCRLR